MKNLKSILILALALIFTSCGIFKAERKAINSIQKLGDDLYFLEWTGDYGLDDFLAEGGAKDNEELATYLGEAFKKGKWTRHSTGIFSRKKFRILGDKHSTLYMVVYIEVHYKCNVCKFIS